MPANIVVLSKIVFYIKAAKRSVTTAAVPYHDAPLPRLQATPVFESDVKLYREIASWPPQSSEEFPLHAKWQVLSFSTEEYDETYWPHQHSRPYSRPANW